MLYETIGQSSTFFIFLLIGILIGLIFSLIFKFIMIIRFNMIRQILLFFLTVAVIILFYIANLLLNYGEFRFFVILALFLGFFAMFYLSCKLFAKLPKFWYTLKKRESQNENDKK